MRKFALFTSLSLAAAALCGIAGVVTAAVADSGSALVVVVVMVLGMFVIGLLEWTHRRGSRLGHPAHQQHASDRDTLRALDELRAARAHQAGSSHTRSVATPTTGTAHGAISHALRSV
jgi:hypothetical protein